MIQSKNKLINLRPIERSDLDQIQKWRNDSNVQPFFREYREMSKEHISKWYESMIPDNRFEFFIVEDQNNNPIGVSGLTYIDWVNRHTDIHLTVQEHNWIDNIYAPEILNIMITYAFDFFNLNKVWAEIYEIDTKKLTLFMNNGFKTDAVLRNHYYHDGTYHNSHIVSLLKNEKNKNL